MGVTTSQLDLTVVGIPDGAAVQPVTVRGPGFTRAIGRTATFTGLVPGNYRVDAGNFTTGAGRPSCRLFTPSPRTRQVTLLPGQAARAAVTYTAGPCIEL